MRKRKREGGSEREREREGERKKERERERAREKERARDRERDGAIPVAWRVGGWPNANLNSSEECDQYSGWVIDQWGA